VDCCSIPVCNVVCLQEVAEGQGILSMPTFIFYHEGRKVKFQALIQSWCVYVHENPLNAVYTIMTLLRFVQGALSELCIWLSAL